MVQVDDAPPDPERPALWPSVGEYPVYDESLYAYMSADQARNKLYLEALREVVPDRVVVDIGTGADLNWAIASAEAGARRVYAIEMMPGTVDRACAKLETSPYRDRIQIIRGSSSSVILPERAGIIVSEIIGCVGSSEGVIAVLGDARERFLEPDGLIIPARCTTQIAAVQLPEELSASPCLASDFSMTLDDGEDVAELAFSSVGYTERVFRQVGHCFDIRLLISSFPTDHLLSPSGVFEHIDFTGPQPLEQSNSARLEIDRAGRLDGLLLWIQLSCGHEQGDLDSLRHDVSWKPVFFPVFYPGAWVEPGTIINMQGSSTLSDDGIHPDYRVRGEVIQANTVTPFDYISSHHGPAFRASPLYEALFSEVSR